MASENKCRICKNEQLNPDACLNLLDANQELVKNWLKQNFNDETPVEEEGFSVIVCWICVNTARALHKFASTCCQLNGIAFEKQDWWTKLE